MGTRIVAGLRGCLEDFLNLVKRFERAITLVVSVYRVRSVHDGISVVICT